ncbi:MAG TPA: laccase domain-containing protein, partial [Polyangiaceae bacterium]|nr:laccase domain-containing protein [Polyangiaceae bacterium]
AAASEPGVMIRAGQAKPHVDLRAAVRAQLVARGLQSAHIDDVPGCTRCDAELFFSHRRDGDAGGRQVGAIAVRR